VRKEKGETGLHAAARHIMLEWLRGAAARAGRDGCATFGPLSWSVNRPEPKWGVFDEYPIIECMCYGCVPVWDEYPAWPMRPPVIVKQGIIPTRSELARAGAPPLAVVDIAIQHKGMISDVIEIVYTSDLTETKLAILSDRARLRVWRADAEWVVKHVDDPQEFPWEGFRSVASFNRKTEEVLKGWRDAGRPDTGILWEGAAAAMVLTLSPKAKQKFDALPPQQRKDFLLRHDSIQTAVRRAYRA